ncbi:MAG: nicotinate phosphoribosyltransferase [Leptolyngbya sp.]|nr:nicotinate phosphoribosyltransferase [Candidatus Melainabacteria bacterium]
MALYRLYRESLSLLTDLYQLTMAYAHWKNGSHLKEAVFHASFRKNPFGGGYAIACGLSTVVDFISNFRFDESDIKYLQTLKGHDDSPLFEQGFLDYLASMRMSVDIDAVADGTVVFAHEPLIRVRGPIIQCQLLETALLTIFNFQTLIATKASRIREAAGEQSILEFGLRRAQGIDGGLTASLSAYIGGCDGTSNVLAGKLFGIPVSGTHAHSWVMSFDDELESFKAYARAMPNNCVFLVDTYDTIDGVRNAIEAAHWLKANGHKFLGIRLDSGDLAYLSIVARQMLDEAGFQDAAIIASNDLDEKIIDSLNAQNAKISVWGVGTKLVTAFDQPALGGVYKLSAIKNAAGNWDYKVKLSEQAVKISNPGIHQVRRFSNADGYVGDMIFDIEMPASKVPIIVDPLDMTRRKRIAGDAKYQDLLLPIFAGGRQIYDVPTIEASKQFVKAQLEKFHFTYKRLLNPHQYPVGLELSLHELKTDLILKERDPLLNRASKSITRTFQDSSNSSSKNVKQKNGEDPANAATQSADPPVLPENLSKSALLIVDAQKGFGHDGELPVPDGEKIVPVINQLMEIFPFVVASQDWHPADHISFAINHANKKIGDFLKTEFYDQPLFPMHCIENTRGAQFFDGLNTEKINEVFRKGMSPDVDSFSAFNDCTGAEATQLNTVLKKKGIENLFVTGLATNYCVKESALDAVKLGYKVFVVEDAIRGIDLPSNRVKSAIDLMKSKGIAFINSEEFLKTIGKMKSQKK